MIVYQSTLHFTFQPQIQLTATNRSIRIGQDLKTIKITLSRAAGFNFRAIATEKDTKYYSVIPVLDILYPIFQLAGAISAEMTDPSSLRAAVLGAVAALNLEY